MFENVAYVNLHSTMYLLKHRGEVKYRVHLLKFTFHYVSIKTISGPELERSFK